jgi:hypothetical protein
MLDIFYSAVIIIRNTGRSILKFAADASFGNVAAKARQGPEDSV